MPETVVTVSKMAILLLLVNRHFERNEHDSAPDGEVGSLDDGLVIPTKPDVVSRVELEIGVIRKLGVPHPAAAANSDREPQRATARTIEETMSPAF